ncbi:MAG: phosphoglucosamine mutase [Pseudomonadota bacterium]|nr:phosphoglucosamine mutase [Pseudomonadota bacterium]
MVKKYFGTDGIRGTVGEEPLTAEFVLRLASAAARVLAPDGGTVAIGKDTRVSGYMLESALEAGFVAAGVDVLILGPLPTPGIAYLTRSLGADFGVVISASHNPYQDNGIKFFDHAGSKLSDEIEAKIETSLTNPATTVASKLLGRAKRVDSARDQYQSFALSTVSELLSLEGMKIVIDGANGSGYKVAPRVFSELNAEVIPIACSPNGRNINLKCGTTYPELLQTTVKGLNADLGIALDGDGDRLIMVDHNGDLVDGDQLLYLISTARKAAGTLNGPVVGTLMSNLGLEKALLKKGIQFERANVGDRYVLELLHRLKGTIGGETSGHLICLDKTTTGDGLVSALQVLEILKDTQLSLAELTIEMQKYPQTMINVDVQKSPDLTAPQILSTVSEIEEELGDRGRVVLRASGTEPVVRVMIEGKDSNQVDQLAEKLAEVVKLNA